MFFYISSLVYGTLYTSTYTGVTNLEKIVWLFWPTLYRMCNAIVVVSAANSSDANMPMMMMETRQQNTEVRVSLSKISDKVDRLTEKVRSVDGHLTAKVA